MRIEETRVQGSWEQLPFCILNKSVDAAKLPRVRLLSRLSLKGGGQQGLSLDFNFLISVGSRHAPYQKEKESSRKSSLLQKNMAGMFQKPKPSVVWALKMT